MSGLSGQYHSVRQHMGRASSGATLGTTPHMASRTELEEFSLQFVYHASQLHTNANSFSHLPTTIDSIGAIQVFLHYGIPQALHSNDVLEFMDQVWKECTMLYGFTVYRSLPY